MGANGADETREHSAPAAPPTLGGLPLLPHDALVDADAIRGRRSAAVGNMGLLGSQALVYDQSSAQIDPEEQSCVLTPGAGQLSWAMYGFINLLPEDSLLMLSVYPLGVAPQGPCYVALSDYSRGVWDWAGFAVPQLDYARPIPQAAGALSPGGTIYVVVATWHATPLAIGHLALQLDCAAPPPEGFDVADGDGVALPVHLSWIDPAVTYDPDGPGPQQYGYNGIPVQRALDPLGQWDDLMQLPPGTASFDDQGTLGSQGGGYYYRLMTLATGANLLPGVPLPGRINLTVNLLQAKFTISPATGSPGVNVTLNAASSIHVGGALKNVLWDFDGNGTWDKDTVPTLAVSHVYPALGRYNPRLKLVMNLGGGVTMTDIAAGFLAVGDLRGDWSQLGRNPQHTGFSPLRGPRTATVRGSYAAGGTFYGPSVAADGTVYAANTDGYIYYLSPNCKLLRKIGLGSAGLSTPAVSRYGYLWLNVASGIAAKQLACVWSNLTVHKYAPVVMTGDPVVTPDGLFVTAADANILYVARPDASGWPTWYYWAHVFPTGTEASTPAVDAAGQVYVAADTVLYKLSAAGKLIWKSNTLPWPMHDPAVAPDGSVYVPMNNVLYAFDLSGFNKWASIMTDASRCIGALAIAGDGNIYVSTNGGRVHAFTPGGWEPYAAYSSPGTQFRSPPVIDGDGNLFLLTAGGSVIALTKKLFLRWSYDLGAAAGTSGLALGNDGTLYAGGTNKLVGLK